MGQSRHFKIWPFGPFAVQYGYYLLLAELTKQQSKLFFKSFLDICLAGRVEVAGAATLRVGAALCAGAFGVALAAVLLTILLALFAIWIL